MVVHCANRAAARLDAGATVLCRDAVSVNTFLHYLFGIRSVRKQQLELGQRHFYTLAVVGCVTMELAGS